MAGAPADSAAAAGGAAAVTAATATTTPTSSGGTTTSTSSRSGSWATWLFVAAALALLPALLPVTVVVALVAAPVAALVWLSSSSAAAPSSGGTPGQASGTRTTAKDEDLGLPPPLPASANGAARVAPEPAARRSTAAAAAAAAAPRASIASAPATPKPVAAAAAPPPPPPPPAAAAPPAPAREASVASSNGGAGASAADDYDNAGGDDAGGASTAGPSREASSVTSLDQQQQQQQQRQQARASAGTLDAAPAAPAAAPAALTGSAAILAKLRQQRGSSAGAGSRPASAAAAAAAPLKVVVAYASQTGTGQEIARGIQAAAAAQGLAAEALSLNELGFDALNPARTPVLVVVASSTGDGDPPDNAAAAYVQLKKPWPAGRLAGVRFTVLGLGDSNYTRFMHVPRAIKNRLQELGAEPFHPCLEADEVDGLEDAVDPWCDALQGSLRAALAVVAAERARGAKAAAAAAAVDSAASSAASSAAPSAEPSSAAPSAEPSAVDDDATKPSPAAAAAAAVAAAAAAAPAAAPPPLSAEASAVSAASSSSAAAAVELVDGLAPPGVDLTGVPPLAPCRVALAFDVAPDAAAAARAKDGGRPSAAQRAHRDAAGGGRYSAAAPFWAPVSDARLLTAAAPPPLASSSSSPSSPSTSSDRVVLHIELDVAGSGMPFGPGDAVGVLPENDPALVDALLQRLGADGDAVFEVRPAGADEQQQQQQPTALLSHIPWPCSVRRALAAGCDLTGPPRKTLLRLLAEHAADEAEKRTLLFLCSRTGRAAYAAEITAAQPSLLDLLRRFPSVAPPLDALLDALPPLAPRMYSLTNAPVAPAAAAGEGGGVPTSAGPHRVQFALSVVRYATPSGERRGVASNWLAGVVAPWLATPPPPEGDARPCVPIFLRPAGDFKPPADLATPLLMVGPGTGVAPFRGFLQARAAALLQRQQQEQQDQEQEQEQEQGAVGRAVLYFGCRRADEDFLYERDWAALQACGALSALRVAFSRADPARKVYVQALLQEDAAEVAAAVRAGAHVYVCGDGARMAKDVHAALAGVLAEQWGIAQQAALDELQAMAKQGRYVRDIWS